MALMNGWITIGTKMDSKQLQRDIEKAKRELEKYDKEAERLANTKAKLDIDKQKAQAKLEELDNQIKKVTRDMQDISSNTTAKDLKTNKVYQDLITKRNELNAKAQIEENILENIKKAQDDNGKAIEKNKQNQNDLNDDLEEYNRLLEKTKKADKREDMFGGIKEGIDNAKEKASGLGETMKNVAHTAVKWGLAMFGIRTAFNFLKSSISTISQYNEQVGADIEYIRFALASTLEPIVVRLISLVKTLLSYVNYVLNSLFGINIFAGATVDKFKGAKKELGGATKQAKELNKQLAGFDEMNVLSDNTDTGGGGGGGGDIGTLPSVDFSKVIDFSNFHPLEWLKETLQKIRDWIYSINWQELGSNVYQSIKAFFTETDWASIFDSIFETIGAVFGALGGFIIGFLKDAWKDISSYFGEWIEKSREQGGNIIDGILAGIGNAILQIGKWIYDHIFKPFIEGFKKAFGIASPSKVMMEMGGYIIDGLKNGLVNIWNKVKSIFESLKTNMVDIFKKAWDGIKNVFSSVGNFFGGIVNTIFNKFRSIGTAVGDVVGRAFKNVINSVISGVERILNSPIRAINGLINTVNKISPVKIGTLSTFSLPRLARGGIINQPGRGVMVGSAIAGERGREGVIPLTDSQQMAMLGEAIGKYVNINATMNNYMNGRLISRELQKIQNESNFAYNR